MKIGTTSKIRDIFWVIRDAGNMVKNRDCPAKFGTVGKYDFSGRDRQRETRERLKIPELGDHGDEKRETRERFQKSKYEKRETLERLQI